MALVRYTKTYTQRRIPKRQRLFSYRFRSTLISSVFVLIGVVLLGNVVIPLGSYMVAKETGLRADAKEEQLPTFERLLPTAKPTPIVVAAELDYTDLSNWFPEQELPLLPTTGQKRYLISIPVLGIEDAEVVLGGKSLDQSLIQYPGTAEPGDFGAPVIFGHSVLRQFYNPKINNPRRYVSIFSTIMTLKKGDTILVDDDGVRYRYEVTDKIEVKPQDRYILEQQRDSRQLKLVTCTPEGTYLRRGIITAALVQ